MSDLEKNEFVPVPLPFQIPEPPDLSKVPIGVLHSATVETLISQTEDLSARLKVQIRRNAVLERRALELEEKTQSIEKEMKTLEQQHELFNEKDIQQIHKIKDLQGSLDSQKKELELLEVRYSEISTLSKSKEEDAQRIRLEFEQKIKDLERLLPLEEENFQVRDENNFFKGKIEELCSYLQKKEEESKELKTQISQRLETISAHEATIARLQEQVGYHQKAVQEKAELENLLILKERETEHKSAQLANDLMVTRQELENTQLAYRTIASEKAQAESHVKSCEETINGLSRDNSELERQIDNLQNLWYKLQAEFEKEKSKTMALTKLNRELSVELQRSKSTPNYEDEFLKKYIINNKNAEA